MNTDHVCFVVVWSLAPSLEVAASVLKMEVGHIIRQAEQLSAAGVPLRDLGAMQVCQGEISRDQTNDTQVSPPAGATSDETTTSYISLLTTDEQLRFYAKYTVGQNGRPSLAESAANYHALKSGDIGRAGIASGLVENAAFEAIAQLAVEPPEGFDPKHPKVEGFVVRHVQHAVRNKLNVEYGWQGKRLCGRISPDAQQKAVVATTSPADADDEISKAKALEVTRACQLEQVRALLPGGAIPTDRAGRISMLRAFGDGKTLAVTNAAEHRFYDVLAKYVRAKLEGHESSGGIANDSSAEESIQAPNKHIEKPQPELSAYEVPESIRQRLVPTATKSPEQRRAERFVVAWQTSSTAREAATRLGQPVKSVTAYARRLRALGVRNLKTLPASAGPLVRGALAAIPSSN